MNKSFHLFRLAFDRTLHLGKGTDFYDRSASVLHSDTLYAAITAVAAQAGVEPADQPHFTLTSAFPFVAGTSGDAGDQKAKDVAAAETHFEYFFPRIVMPRIAHDQENSKPRKALKKLRWLNQKDFEKAIAGEDMPTYAELEPRMAGGYLFGNDWMERRSSSPCGKELSEDLPFTKDVVQRVRIPREEGKDALPFYVERLFFRRGSGFFFLADCEDATARWLDKVLAHLGTSGLGTDRNVGYGQFKATRDTLSLRLPDKGDAAANLGLYLPSDREELRRLLDGKGLRAHRLLERGGWISTEPYQTLRKHTVNMIEEGGVFAPIAEAPATLGRQTDLTPKPEHVKLDHSILRRGDTVFIPVKLADQ